MNILKLILTVSFISCVLLDYSYAFGKRHRYRKGEVIIKLRSESSGPFAKPLSLKAHNGFMSKMQKKRMHTVGLWQGLNMQHIKADDSTKSVDDMVNELKDLPEVEYVEPNYIVDKLEVGSPSSQAYTLAQVLNFTSGMGFPLTSAAIQAVPSWPLVSSSGQTIVAVIDTGLDLSHPSFTNAIWTNSGEIAGNGIDDDHNGYIDDIRGWNFAYNNNNPTDDEGHGTHVAGITLGVSQNILTTPASSTDIQIMPLKFLDSTGSGATSDAIKAIYYAANNGAKIMNNSWGGGGYSVALAEAITYAYYKDALFVVAAGNAGTNNDSSPTYPASYNIPNVVAVAASDDYDFFASFSNFGTQSVHLSSPGVAILSTYPGGLFAYLSGTSMASPFVAGAAGMMRHEVPGMNVYQIRQILLGATDAKSNLSSKVQTSGRLNVYSAVNSAKNTSINSYKPDFYLQVSGADRGLASSMANRGGGCGLVSVVGKDIFNNDDQQGPTQIIKKVIITIGLFLLPLVLLQAMRTPERKVQRRKHERFEVNSSVSLKLGDEELVGSLRTISVGGSEIRTDALLKDGSVITMAITSPDGKTKIEVQGHIVWSEAQKRYGVQFKDVSEAIQSQIAGWTQALKKAS